MAALCRRHRVARLDVFGSAARQSHGAADLDLLVEFEDLPADAYADAYFGLLADLKALLRRPIDLVMASRGQEPVRPGDDRPLAHPAPCGLKRGPSSIERASVLIDQFRQGRSFDDYLSDALLRAGGSSPKSAGNFGGWGIP